MDGVSGAGPSELPSGIVTFVFTDIEQSTRLLRDLGDRYGEILDRHFALLREAWLAHDGHEIDHAGDSVFVVFQEAEQAVRACAAAQRLLASEQWPVGDQVRVRIGVHSALASPRGDTYVALGVHQAARVMAAGHGGQVLVSAATAERLPELGDIDLVPIGRYRMRDFDAPAPLFQLAGAGLVDTFPAVRALPADGHNLVAPPTPFVGREAERCEVADLLAPRRLVTLTGPGGVGKSRLATEVGLARAAAWVDGVWLVDLASLQDPAQLATAVGGAVGAPAQGGARWDDVIEHLRKREALVVLDGCEHLAAAAAGAAASLLAACRGCGVLATSRVPLGLAEEVLVRVEPLPVPSRGATSVEEVSASPAVALFLERARAVRRDVEIDGRTAAVVAGICAELDGLPLALELAAARLGALSLQQVLDGLDDRFRLLRSRSTTVPARQRTMQGLLEWSDRLLDDAERSCLRRLGVFGASFGLDAAVGACADGILDPGDVHELVYSLVEKSLVVADLTAEGSRYRLLESVRAFARRQLEDDDDALRTTERLAGWYLDRIGPACRVKPRWTSETGVEIGNLRALIPTLVTADPEMAQELALTIGRYHDAAHAFRTGVEEVGRFVDELSHPSPVLVSLLACLGDLHLRTGDIAAAEAVVAEAERLAGEVGGPPQWDDVAVERTAGEIEARRGNHAAAVIGAHRALARDLSVRGRARMCSQLGVAALAGGDLDTAWEACGRELAAYEELGDESFQASAHGNLAEIALRRGDEVAAARHQQACLALALELGAPAMVAFSLIVAARLSAGDGHWATATTLHAQAETILEAIGLALYDDDRKLSDAMLEAARDHLGFVAFSDSIAAGRALPVPDAAELADGVLAAAGHTRR